MHNHIQYGHLAIYSVFQKLSLSRIKSLLLLFSILFVTACSSKKDDSVALEKFPITNPILLDTIYSQEYVAHIHSVQNIEVRARVNGYLEKIYVDEGHAVKKGQLLFSISSAEYKEELAKARAMLKSSIADAKAAEVDLQNAKRLVERNVVSKTELDMAQSKPEALNARIEKAQSYEASAKLQLAYTDVHAPFDGIIVRIPFKTGSLIEDQGTFYASITTPSGSTLERTKAIVNEVQKSCEGIDAIESVSSLAGTNILSDGTGATYGTCLINLKNWDDRKESVDEVTDMVIEKTSHIKDVKIEFFPPPAVPGYGNASGFELRLLDKTGNGDFKKMETVVQQFITDLKARPEIASAFTIFDASYPQYLLNVDEDKAAQKQVSDNAMGTLQTLLGSEHATNFIKYGQMYKVMVQALPEYRAKPEDLLKLYVKNDADEMVPLAAFMTIERVYGVDQITRYNMYPSAELNGEAGDGYSSGAAIAAIQEVAKEKLPRGFDIDWAGITRDQVFAGNEAIYVFLICLAFVYLVLAAQYESFLLPMPCSCCYCSNLAHMPWPYA